MTDREFLREAHGYFVVDAALATIGPWQGNKADDSRPFPAKIPGLARKSNNPSGEVMFLSHAIQEEIDLGFGPASTEMRLQRWEDV